MTEVNQTITATELQGPIATQTSTDAQGEQLSSQDNLALATLNSHVGDSTTQASELEVAVENAADSDVLTDAAKTELAGMEPQLAAIKTDLQAASTFADKALVEQTVTPTLESGPSSLGEAQQLADTANRDLVGLQHRFDSLTTNSADNVVDTLNAQSTQASDPGVLVARADSTLVAQNNATSGASGAQQYQIQSAAGNLNVTDSRTTVSDGSANYSVRVVTVTRQTGPSDAPVIAADALGPELGTAASWLRNDDIRNGLPPKTVQWAQNEATGETAIQFWRGDGNRGELDMLALREPNGWVTVPRDVLNHIPQDRVLDVVDPQGTSFNLRLDNDNQNFWQASFDNARDQRVTLSFTPDNRLALVETEVAPGEVVYDHKEAFDDLNITTNNIDAFPGGRVEYDRDTAVAISAAGDIRVNYARGSDGQFQRESTVEMVYKDGQPTDYRVFQSDETGMTTLSTLMNADAQLTDVAPVNVNPDGSLSFVESGLTADLADSSLQLPSGRTLNAVRSGPDPSLPVYPGQSTGNESANVNGVSTSWSAPTSYEYTNKTTVEQKAGYDDGEGVFRNYTIEVNGQQYQYELLPYKNNTGVFADRSGVEYYANTRTESDGTEVLVVGNIQNQSAVDAGILTTRVTDGAFLVPAQGNRANEYMAELAEQGLEPLAVLGTGFIDAGNENAGIGYQYFNAERLSNPDAPASAGTVYADAFYEKISAGYMVDRDGNMTLLDYSGQSNAEIRQELAALQENPDVVAINIFAHDAAEQPEDLVGVLEATTEPSSVGKARSYMVFNADGEFVGHSVSPAMSLLDSVTLAKQTFGEEAAYTLNMDGDFYAQNWFADGRDGSSNLARRYENAMILVRPTADGGPAPYQQEDPATSRAEDENYRNAENDDVKDAIEAIRERLF